MDDILLVEDDPNDVELTKLALRHSGFGGRLDVVPDGASALGVLDERSAVGRTPRVVFLDLKLPGMSGLEVLRSIREKKKFDKLPVVILTSSGLAEEILACYEEGANSFVVKPVDPGEFRRVVETLGQYWGKMNRV